MEVCPQCTRGHGWVCENHPNVGWGWETCCGGAGLPCPGCNPGGCNTSAFVDVHVLTQLTTACNTSPMTQTSKTEILAPVTVAQVIEADLLNTVIVGINGARMGDSAPSPAFVLRTNFDDDVEHFVRFVNTEL